MDKYQSGEELAKARYEGYKKSALRLTAPKGFTGKLADLGLDPDRTAKAPVRAAILRDKGTNGEREMAYALYLAGFDVKDVHLTDLISGRETLDDVQLIVFCGGFSNSDVSARLRAGQQVSSSMSRRRLRSTASTLAPTR